MRNTRQSLLTYLAVMVVLCAALQVVIAVFDPEITLIAALGLVVVALYYAYFQYSSRHALAQLRFGRLVSHAIAFVVVNLSYHIHAAIRLIVEASDAHEFRVDLPPGWYGVLFGMFVFWGMGFLIHLTASVAMRGFEELPKPSA